MKVFICGGTGHERVLLHKGLLEHRYEVEGSASLHAAQQADYFVLLPGYSEERTLHMGALLGYFEYNEARKDDYRTTKIGIPKIVVVGPDEAICRIRHFSVSDIHQALQCFADQMRHRVRVVNRLATPGYIEQLYWFVSVNARHITLRSEHGNIVRFRTKTGWSLAHGYHTPHVHPDDVEAIAEGRVEPTPKRLLPSTKRRGR